MLQTAAAIGQAWVGLHVARVPSLGLYCEDGADELIIRQDDINAALACEYVDLADAGLRALHGEDAALIEFDRDRHGSPTPLWFAIRAEALRRGVGLIIVDGAADSFSGNENARSEVRQFLRLLGRLARETNAAVLLLAHPSKSGIASGEGDGGSTDWTNGVRSRLYLSRPVEEDGEPADTTERVLSRKKSNYAAAGDEIRMKWVYGAFIAERTAAGGIVGAIDKRSRESEAEAVFLDCLRKIKASGRHASDTSASRDAYAPKLFRTLPRGREWSVRDLKRAMERLFEAGRIRRAGVLNANRNYVASIVEVVELCVD